MDTIYEGINKKGESFVICFADWQFEARAGGRRVGYAWCRRKGPETLVIIDLCIDAAAPVLGWVQRLRVNLFLRAKRVSFRRRGIGSAMVDALIGASRAGGINTISGYITPADLDQFPSLPEWYKKKGFVVTDNSAGIPPNARYLLSLDLR